MKFLVWAALSFTYLVLQAQAGDALRPRQASSAGSGSPTSSGSRPAPTVDLTNFCGSFPNLALADGSQIRDGSCNKVPLGVIPSSSKMPSVKIISPQREAIIPPNTDFTVTTVIRNLASGFATDSGVAYLTVPPKLDPSSGFIQGHLHIVIEQVTSPSQTTATDPAFFAFFKALNDPAVDGKIEAQVSQGLPEGQYRVCTLTSSESHNPLAMPVAQRGSMDDCIYFIVGASASSKLGNAASGSWHTSTISFIALFVSVHLYFLY